MRNILITLCFMASLPALAQNRYQLPTSNDASNAAISQFIASQPPSSVGSTTVVPMGDTGVNTIFTPTGNYTAITNSSLNTTTITSSSGKPITTCITSPFGVTSCQ